METTTAVLHLSLTVTSLIQWIRVWIHGSNRLPPDQLIKDIVLFTYNNHYYSCILRVCVCVSSTGASAALHPPEAHRRRDAAGHEEGAESEGDAAVQHHVHVQTRERQVTRFTTTSSL